MKNVFTPIFLATLCLLTIVHYINPYFEIIEPLSVISFAIALLLFTLKKYHASYCFIVLALALMIAFQFLEQRYHYLKEIETGIPQDRYITITGHLTDFPGIRDDHSALELAVHTIEYEEKSVPRHFNTLIHVTGNLSDLNRGDEVRIDTRLYPLRFNETLAPSPMRANYLYRGIHFRGYCKSSLFVTKIKTAPLPWRIIGAWRQSIASALNRRYAENSTGGLRDEGVFLSAILLGDRGKMTSKQKEKLLSSGIFHLFSISGAHIGIIALFSLLLLKVCKCPFRWRNIFTAILLVVFLALTGFKISAQRAVIMALMIFWARILYDDYDIFNIISASGLVLLLMNPAEFMDAGFLLTYTLTAAIILGRRLFAARWKNFPRYPAELVSANLSASIVAFPLSLFFFKRYSFAGIFTGLLLLPLTALILGISILLLPLAPLSSSLADSVIVIIDPFLKLFFLIVDLCCKIWNFDIYRPSPPLVVLALILVLYASMASGRQLGKLRLFYILPFTAILLYLLVGSPPYNPGQLEVYFLDVGQGDCTCVVFPGGDALLVDGGGSINEGFEVGKNLVLPFLLQRRIQVKWVLVSHYHPDHASGIIEIIDCIKPAELWIASVASEDRYYKKLISVCPESCQIRYVDAEFGKTIGDCRIQIVYPPDVIQSYFSKNNHSAVVKITDPSHAFLLTGDIEQEAEERLASSRCGAINVDVLKVAHHGSRSSSGITFLKCATPKVSILSTASGNRFGFPHREVVLNHKECRIPILSTATRGGIRIISSRTGLTIDTTR